MARKIVLLSFLIVFIFTSSVFVAAEDSIASNQHFSLEVSDHLINLHAEQASVKEILTDLEKKTGIKVNIFDGVEDKKVSLDISSLPIYAIHTLLEKMEIENFAVVYDTQLASKVIYILPKGQDIAEVLKGKTSIRPARFADGKNVNQIKGHEIPTITRGKNNVPIRYVKDEVLLKFHLGVTRPEIEEVLKKHNLILVDDKSLSKIGYVKAKIPDGREVTDVIKEVSKEYRVKIPEPNYIAGILTVTDPLYESQWYVKDTNFDKAWDVVKKTDQVKVALIDTGINSEHPDLKGRVLQGYDYVNNDNGAIDDHGHGTFVSGIIAATANDIGIKGLYDYAQIIPVKVIDANGIGTYEDTAKGIIYAVDNGAKVINMSIGGYGYSFMLQDAVDYALEKGSIIVAAGGNDGIEQEIYPAGYPDVIGVSALGNKGQIWSSSNSGRHIDVSAPGVNIVSTGLDSDYVYATGTSASTPMVSALAGMLASERSYLSSSVIERLIMQSAKDLGDKGRDKVYGSGEIDALASLEQEVKPFHDVAVRSVNVEPMVFEKEKPTYVVANIENAGTYKSETFEVVLYQIDGEDKKEIGRKEGIEVLDKTKVVFEWKPAGLEDNIKFEALIISADDEITSNNSKTTLIYSLQEKDYLYVLYANIPPVHGWIAFQAFNTLADGGLKTEMSSYLPQNSDSIYYLSNFGTDGNPIPPGWALTDWGDNEPLSEYTSLIEGAWEEDENFRYFHHFWDPDQGYNFGMDRTDVCPQSCDSALKIAVEDRFKKAIEKYPANPKEAYYWLGRTAHLLMDMTVPEHVHNDIHPAPTVGDDDSSYEQYTANNNHYKAVLSDNLIDNSPLGIKALPLSVPSDYENIDVPGGYDGSNYAESKLVKLFYNTAQYTQFFDSDDESGSGNINGTTYSSLWQGTAWGITPENGAKQYHALEVGESIDDSSEVEVEVSWFEDKLSPDDFKVNYSSGVIYISDDICDFADPDDEIMIRYRHNGEVVEAVPISFVYIPDNDILEEDLKTHQDKLQGFAIRSVAALYRLFREITHPVEHYLLSGTIKDQNGNSLNGHISADEITNENLGNYQYNANGNYAFALFPGTYNLYGNIEISYYHGTLSLPIPKQEVEVYFDKMSNITYTLPDYRHVRGRVTNDSGSGIANVSIHLSSAAGVSSSTYTASDGTYDALVVDGTYGLWFRHSSYIGESDFIVVNGDVTKNISLVEQQFPFTLSGKMTNQYESPVRGGISISGPGFNNYVSTESDGTYFAGLPQSGTYVISASFGKSLSNGYISAPISTYPKSISINGNEKFDIKYLSPSYYTIFGRVTDTNNNGQSNTKIELWEKNRGDYVRITTGSGGSYSISMPEGNYRARISAPPTIFPPFETDNISIFNNIARDFPLTRDVTIINEAKANLEPSLSVSQDRLALIDQGSSSSIYEQIRTEKETLQPVLNWSGSEMAMTVYRPDGSVYGQYQSTTPPIVVDIPNPELGTWQFNVTAIEVPHNNYAYAFVAGVTPNQQPLADSGGPYSGNIGSIITVSASGSHDPDGSIAYYDWDWDSDGFFDERTTSPIITHAWTSNYYGSIRLRVTDNEGMTALDTAIMTTYDTSATSQVVASREKIGYISITTSNPNYSWEAVSNESWITITSGSAGTGNGTITYSVSANDSPDIRVGTITIAGKDITIKQAGTNQRVMTVTKTGTGSGIVTSTDEGINCGYVCSEIYERGTLVSLEAWENNSVFSGWSGDCTGIETCTITMDVDREVTAEFKIDSDSDRISDQEDNCPSISNPGQEDTYIEGYGDACTVAHCVTNSTELQYALHSAERNGKNDLIQVVQGTYRISENSRIRFNYSSEPYGLSIKGGYTSACMSSEINPSLTVLDGENISQYAGGVLYLDGNSSTSDERLIVENLTIQNGNALNGGGIYVYSDRGSVALNSIIIKGNTSDAWYVGGGGAYIYAKYGSVDLTNTVITGNTARSIGGAYLGSYQGKINLVNNTIAGNSVTTYHDTAGIYLDFDSSALANMYNNIIWGNIAPDGDDIDITDCSGGIINAFSNDFDPAKVAGTFTSTGNNINTDPLFVDVVNGNFHLRSGSPTIDAGNNSAPSLPSTDFEGDNRVLGISPDIGADEYYTTGSTYSIGGQIIKDGTSTGTKNVELRLTGATYTNTKISNDDGSYIFTWVPDGNYTITPSHTLYSFVPTDISITVNGSALSGQNFTAIPADTDSDGIPDDGDGSDIAGDSPCTEGNNTDCDDNCVNTSNSDQADADGDGVGNTCDTDGAISGRVIEEDTGLPIAAVFVDAYDGPGNLIDRAVPYENGYYSISGLQPGEYRILVWGYESPYVTEYYNDACDWNISTPVVVTAGINTGEINFSLHTIFDFYCDDDNDGNISIWPSIISSMCHPGCQLQPGDDCNDYDYMINPSSTEICDGIDNNCDGTIDEGGDSDSDVDGFMGCIDNCPNDSNSDQMDTDNDGLGNVCDSDDDNDGLTDNQEATYNTDPLDPDSDNDGYSDGEEVAQGTDPLCERSYPGDYSVHDDLTVSFIDISVTGTDSSIHDDDYGVELPMGFDFKFYGQAVNTVWVSSNGYLTFDPTDTSSYSTTPLPDPEIPNSMIAPFCDDLNLSNSGSIMYQTTGTAPNRQFIVMYNQVPFYDDSSSSLTFEVILSETDNSITFIYASLLNGDGSSSDGSSATVGIENSTGTVGTEYSYNGSNALHNGLTVKFSLIPGTGTCADTDADGVYDDIDNCSETPNTEQQNTDTDVYGNICDCDLDNDGFVGPNDYNMFGMAWWSSVGSPNWNPNADFDSDGFVGPNDYNILGSRWWTVEPWD